jgi:uncharacterized protein (TIGR03790 family)
LIVALVSLALASADFNPTPPGRLTPANLAVVINTADPLSAAIGEYYVRKRHIPPSNVVKVTFGAQRDTLSEDEFTRLRASTESQLGPQVQAYALTWARPYRVGCMSITAAFAFGVDKKYCADGCALTEASPYFNAAEARPHDLRMRLAMSIAAVDFAHAKTLIDRGVQSDSSRPAGNAYLVATKDASRNVRAAEYIEMGTGTLHGTQIVDMQAAAAHDLAGVMFYFTGAPTVDALTSDRFLPGAVADHLTSFGGMLTDSGGQMSSLRWLEAGATGSYGTVVEPCNFLSKFPNIGVLMNHYLAGDTLIEAYWKSVAMPGQGVFIGEPLAAPFAARPLHGR